MDGLRIEGGISSKRFQSRSQSRGWRLQNGSVGPRRGDGQVCGSDLSRLSETGRSHQGASHLSIDSEYSSAALYCAGGRHRILRQAWTLGENRRVGLLQVGSFVRAAQYAGVLSSGACLFHEGRSRHPQERQLSRANLRRANLGPRD